LKIIYLWERFRKKKISGMESEKKTIGRAAAKLKGKSK